MKRIIDGKSYNTETAECIATWSNHHYPNDFHYCEESLYRTAKGAWFVAGEGGAMSKYSRPVGNNGRGGGEGLEPFTADEARRWLEEHNFVDELEEHFGSQIEEA
jgi:hypothetical protein